MRRRDIIAGLGGTAAWPLVAHAQQRERTWRIAVLIPSVEDSPVVRVVLPTLRQELQKFGWIEGRNMRLEIRFAGTDRDRIAAAARELVGLAPDLIFTVGATSIVALRRETQVIPIVFAKAGDTTEGTVANIARPERNVTGFASLFWSFSGKWLQLLKDAAPQLARVAVVFNPDIHDLISGGGGYAAAINAGAPVLGIEIIWTSYRTAAELERAIDAFATEQNGGLLLLPGNERVAGFRETILPLATKYRLPAISSDRDYAEDGILLSYGANYLDTVRQSVSYIDRILRGAKPGDLPVAYPTKFDLVINLKTAKAIGITFPVSLIALADKVIE